MKNMKDVYVTINKKLYERVSSITTTDYQIVDNKIEINNLLGMMEDLLEEYDRLEEEFDDMKNDIEYNYKRVPVNEQYEIYDRDFI